MIPLVKLQLSWIEERKKKNAQQLLWLQFVVWMKWFQFVYWFFLKNKVTFVFVFLFHFISCSGPKQVGVLFYVNSIMRIDLQLRKYKINTIDNNYNFYEFWISSLNRHHYYAHPKFESLHIMQTKICRLCCIIIWFIIVVFVFFFIKPYERKIQIKSFFNLNK